MPISRTLYDGIRQIIQSFSDPEKTGFMQVVMVEYPRKGIHTIGFVTNEHIDETGKKLVNVFIPNFAQSDDRISPDIDEAKLSVPV